MAAGGTKINSVIADDAPKQIIEARKLLGVKEYINIKGKRSSNPIILQLFKEIGYDGFSAIDTPWCAVFMGAMLERSGYRSTRKMNARSYLDYGTDAADNPTLGDIVVMWRGSRDDGITGHIYFFIKQDGNFIYGLGGNQGDEVNVSKFPKSKVLAIRRPRQISASKTLRSAIGSAVTGTASKIAEQAPKVVDTAQGTLTETQSYFDVISPYMPKIALALAAISILLAFAAAYYRYSDHKESGI